MSSSSNSCRTSFRGRASGNTRRPRPLLVRRGGPSAASRPALVVRLGGGGLVGVLLPSSRTSRSAADRRGTAPAAAEQRPLEQRHVGRQPVDRRLLLFDQERGRRPGLAEDPSGEDIGDRERGVKRNCPSSVHRIIHITRNRASPASACSSHRHAISGRCTASRCGRYVRGRVAVLAVRRSGGRR